METAVTLILFCALSLGIVALGNKLVSFLPPSRPRANRWKRS